MSDLCFFCFELWPLILNGEYERERFSCSVSFLNRYLQTQKYLMACFRELWELHLYTGTWCHFLSFICFLGVIVWIFAFIFDSQTYQYLKDLSFIIYIFHEWCVNWIYYYCFYCPCQYFCQCTWNEKLLFQVYDSPYLLASVKLLILLISPFSFFHPLAKVFIWISK